MPNRTRSGAHSIWLLPAPPEAAALQEAVNDFAARYGLPRFVPHMTLLGDLTGPVDTTAAALAARCAGAGPFQAEIRAVARTPAHFMSLFLDLSPVPDPGPLRQALARDLGKDPGPFRPHVSLAYGLDSPDPADLRRLEQRFIGQTLVFRTAAVVMSAQVIPVDAWQIAETIGL